MGRSALLLVFLAAPPYCAGQLLQGTIDGIVTDPSHDAVAGASVAW